MAGPFLIPGETTPEHELFCIFITTLYNSLVICFSCLAPEAKLSPSLAKHNRSLITEYDIFPILFCPVFILQAKCKALLLGFVGKPRLIGWFNIVEAGFFEDTIG